MYRLRILYGIVDAHDKAFERELEKCLMPVAGDDLEKAKAEAERFAAWNHHYARYFHAAKTNRKLPEWKQRTLNKKKAHDKRYEERPRG